MDNGKSGETNEAFEQSSSSSDKLTSPSASVSRSRSVHLGESGSATPTAVDMDVGEHVSNIWNQSPYTYKQPLHTRRGFLAQSHSSCSEAYRTPVIEENVSGKSLPTVDVVGRPNGLFSSTESSAIDNGGQLSDAVWASAPIGHYADFYGPDELKSFDNDDVEYDESYLNEERIIWGDRKTLFGRIQNKLLEEPSKRVISKESRKQARNGVRLADVITKVPLSKVWHRFTEFLAIAVFLSNVVVAAYDIIRDASNLQYKVTALIFGVIENIIIVSLWAVSKHPRFKKSKNFERRLKHFQYAENIVHELLIYPLIIINIVGFATEKMYQTPSDAFGWTQLILLVIDFSEVILTQCVRIYMLYRFTKDILKVIDPEENTSWWRNSLASNIIQRSFVTFVGNIVLMLVLSAMFGIQVHEDNFTSNDYHLSLESSMLMLSFLVLPTGSILLFTLINAYWILEILIDLNLHVAGDKQFSSKLKESYGEIVHDAVEFAQKTIPASKGRLETLQRTSTRRKVFFGIIEIRILLCIFLYEVFIVFGFVFFSGFNNTLGNLLMKCGFGLVLLLANLHLIMLVILGNFSIIVLVVSVLFYPISVPLCCRKRHTVTSSKRVVKTFRYEQFAKADD